MYQNNSTFRLLESGNYCARKPLCLYLLGIERLFLKMHEDENPIVRRRRINNERQARYRVRHPSEAGRKANAEFQRIRCLTISPNLVCDKEFTSVEHLFTKPSNFDGFQLVYRYGYNK